ncbi:MAG TPA: von Willebrand factor type A domain-containing protein [Anaerolineales bacterium]|nr:von Willebrand factor type A domain-containing protein [Anaerolineales bacterium]
MSTRKARFLAGLAILGILATACKAAGPPEPSYYLAPPAPSPQDIGPTYGGLNPVNGQPYHDVFFENYGVNPFVDTEDDQLSTFALDVDTGSYTVARRYLSDGYLPPKDAIRVEEFVNFFDLNYAEPERSAFSINLDGGPTPFVQNERYRVIRIGIQGMDVPDEERADAVLTFVIDVSGSMGYENRLEAVKRALSSMVETLRPQDQVGIVVYGSDARVVLETTPVSERRAILRAIERLEPEGATNAEAGLRLGYRMASEAFSPEKINRVILCSDGVANVGETGPDAILEAIRGYADEGIQLTTVGFGMGNYNDVLMERLADDGDGFYAYVDTAAEAEKLFVADLTGTLQTIALDAKIQVEFNPEVVTRYRLLGFENRALMDEEFRDDSADAGEIGAGHSVTALYEVKLTEGAQGTIAKVALRWEDPQSHEVTELTESIASEALALSFDKMSPTFQLAVFVAEYAEILRESYWAQNFTLEGLAEELSGFDLGAFDDEEILEFGELVDRAVDLSGQEE